MTEKILRDTLKEAQAKDQLGLLVWANWRVWNDSAFEMKPGNKDYDFAFSQILKGEEATSELIGMDFLYLDSSQFRCKN